RARVRGAQLAVPDRGGGDSGREPAPCGRRGCVGGTARAHGASGVRDPRAAGTARLRPAAMARGPGGRFRRAARRRRMSPMRGPASRAGLRGFTLIELLVAMAIVAVIG